MRVKIIGIIAFMLTTTCWSQNGIHYKAVIKDNSGNILVNELVDLQFTILKTSKTGTVVYSEDYATETDINGLIIHVIGQGAVSEGVFSNIDWGSDLHFLNLKVDIGAGYEDMGTTVFNNVPYANTASKISDSPSRTLEVGGIGEQNLRVYSKNGGNTGFEFLRAGSKTDWRMATNGSFLHVTVAENGFENTNFNDVKFAFRDNGRLGVNTPFPSKELDVDGTIRTRDLAGIGTRIVSANEQGDLVIDTEPKFQYVSISPSAFNASGANFSSGGSRVAGQSGSTSALRAPVSLPHGAVITNWKVYYTDNSERNLLISFAEAGIIQNGILFRGQIATSGSSIDTQVGNINSAITIDNLERSYHFRVVPLSTVTGNTWVGISDLNIKGIVITYQLP